MNQDEEESNEWVVERVFRSQKGVQTIRPLRDVFHKNTQAESKDDIILMMIGHRMADFKVTRPKGYQKLDKLDGVRVSGHVILQNIFDSFTQLKQQFHPNARRTPFANTSQSVSFLTGVALPTIFRICHRNEIPKRKPILDMQAYNRKYYERKKMRKARLLQESGDLIRTVKMKKKKNEGSDLEEQEEEEIEDESESENGETSNSNSNDQPQ
ncbi:hypothetical protein WR25_20935 [Diploscapter pachys]|uniref:Uncharacterized protein n=1 Tax=Diploscapter pachys TaxID=2018661 RepID=A0A2A2KAN4_9BILA|nr:hypothetical protein WR25_20935 [Diploscapter pachys]